MERDCNTGLLLGLGRVSADDSMRSIVPPEVAGVKKKLQVLKFDDILPSLTLGLSIVVEKSGGVATEELNQRGCSGSPVSSFSNSSGFKRERDGGGGGGGEEAEAEEYMERVCMKVGEEDEDGSPRKKLRLTKQQSAILEDNFKEHSSLSPKQKQDLAKQLNLRPRQVEVWFQNRRARTKLKQTEMDCELLKKCCEKLKEENTRLQKELQELKSLKLTAPPFCMQLQAATLTVCPSCESSICGGGGGGDASPANTFSIVSKPQFLKFPFNHPSAAC
ncbi:homeobox-leucine zipper protein HAT22-like [Benincasa hispida]|uniref:homeobox-leucine zipper protein HAT22-like n=1 Tax=Benincasa hispida TaxID=102211 RepID=UPI0019012315|nr:homeobox-leucine zipper protein HAT22-like [Benincasa hispida]